MIKTNKGNVMIALLAVVVLVGIGIWYVASREISALTEPTSTVTPTPKNSIDTSDWQTYTNDEYWFSFRYPSDLSVETPAPTSSKQLVSFGKRGPNDLQDIHANDSLWFGVYISDSESNFNEFVNSNVYKRLISKGDDVTDVSEGEKLVLVYDDEYFFIDGKQAFGFSYVDYTGSFDLDTQEIIKTRITQAYYIELNDDQILVFSSDLRDSTSTNLDSYRELFRTVVMSFDSFK